MLILYILGMLVEEGWRRGGGGVEEGWRRGGGGGEGGWTGEGKLLMIIRCLFVCLGS